MSLKSLKKPIKKPRLKGKQEKENKKHGIYRRNYYDRGYYEYVRSLPCVITGKSADAHHLIHKSSGVVLDCLLIPISQHPYHSEIHFGGGYQGLEDKYGITWDWLIEKAIEIWDNAPSNVKIENMEIDRDILLRYNRIIDGKYVFKELN